MLFLDKQKIVVDNFEKILLISNQKIELIIDNTLYVLKGDNFHIIYFEKKELIIEGQLKEFRRELL